MNLPSISVIMPVYNEEAKIGQALQSIRTQDYPQNKVEIIIVDDDSTDRTLEIAKKYDIIYCRNGRHDYDIGKSLGIKKAKHEYLLFLDGDNILPRKSWLKTLVSPFISEKDVVGAQPIWFTYRKEDSLADRYCTLFGITDPLTIYLKKRDRLMLSEKKWDLVKYYTEKNGYFLVQFTPKTLPTIGSVGFIIKKALILKTNYTPAFSHLDCIMDLVNQGKNRFAMVKLDIIHLHSSSVEELIRKLKRNITIFLRDREERRYRWVDSPLETVIAALKMFSIVVPFYHSVKGFIHIRDIAWFIHPYVCFRVAWMYSTKMLGHYFRYYAMGMR